MRLTYYRNLDGVRALAALMVMFYHSFRDIHSDNSILRFLSGISEFGQTGVTLFFVLSGFLITRILLNTKRDSGYFKNFYVRRILRIFPLYYLFLILYYLVSPFVLETGWPTLDQQFYYFAYLQNVARTFDWNSLGPHHFWSLAVEEHFYLFWPLAVYTLTKKGLARFTLAIIIFAMVLRAVMLHLGYSVFIFTFTRFDALALGALLSLMELKNAFRHANARKYSILLITLLIPILLLWVFFSGLGNDYIQNLRYLLLASAFFAFIGMLLSLDEGHIFNRILKTRFLSYTGRISYGIYVYHPLVFLICVKYLDTGNVVVNVLISTVCTYTIATLSYHYFESYFLRLKKHFRDTKSQREKKQICHKPA
jgi:peptidoglycan/LPS O-acetylase OafA/YrhL